MPFPPVTALFDGSRPVVLFGAARLGRQLLAKLRALGIHVAAFGDNDPAKWGSEIAGVPILSKPDIATRHPNAAIVIASLLFEYEMARELSSFPFVYPFGYLNLARPDVFDHEVMTGLLELSRGFLERMRRARVERAHVLRVGTPLRHEVRGRHRALGEVSG